MKIVDNHHALTLGMYERIREIFKNTEDELDRQVKTLAVLADVDEEDILSLPIDEYKRMVAASNFLGEIDPSSHRVAKSYNLGGFKLAPTTDYRKMITSQYVDFMELTKDDEPDEHIVELLSIVLVPEGKTYGKGYDIAEVQEAIRRHMPFADACSLLAFFLTQFRALIADSLRYSMEAARGMKDKEMKAKMIARIKEVTTLLQEDGDGSPM